MFKEQAYEFARAAHRGQKRWGGEDYFDHHLVPVSELTARKFGKDDLLQSVAFLHDTAEDTPVTIEDIRRIFNQLIADAVDLLTQEEGQSYYDYILRIITGSSAAHEIAVKVKICDIEHNSFGKTKGSLFDKWQLATHLLKDKL